jgi:uncharacterized protein (TIRG00374 family)
MFKSKIFVGFQYLIFIVISAVLLKLSFNKIDVNSFYNTLIVGNYWVALWVFIISILAYVSRIYRWNIILKKVNANIGFMNNFSAIAIGYLVSYIFPRGGEVVKCMLLKKTDNLSISQSVSSTFFERIVDLLCLVILLVFVFGAEFITNNYLITNLVNPNQFIKNYRIWAVIAVGIIIAIIGFVIYNKFKTKDTWLVGFINNLKEMLSLLVNIRFSLHTIFIWLSYYLMTYLWFFVFESTSNLSLFQAFQIMMIGTVARSLPLPGGAIGAYHLAIVFGLTAMGIDKELALGMSFIIHGFQTIFTVFAGFVGIVWLFINKTYRIR